MIKLELSIDETNMILRVLGQHPFAEVATLISKIKEQGEPQVVEIAKQAEADSSEADSSEAAA